ncbi:MAG: c-type cytochrome [Magnetococcales bacterium]|nr:c-type cytochrome [Magnetococcales bacterium]
MFAIPHFLFLRFSPGALVRRAAVSLMVCLPWLSADAAAPAADLYRKHCAVCHGKSGDGRTTAGSGMQPPPGDFTAPGALVTLTRERMVRSIREGRKGTAMVAWQGVLSDEEILAVTEYIRDDLMLSSYDKDASPGRKIFASNCSVCHGDKGDVAVWARSGLSPAPRNFTSDLARRELTRERMVFSVTYGRAETAMPAWVGRLKTEEIEQVVDYIRHAFLFPGGAGEPARKPEAAHDSAQPHDHNSHFDTASMNAPMPKGLTGNVVWGKQFYDRHCADCHGETGDGKGRRSEFIYPKPRNFLHPASQHKFNRSHLFDVIAEGMRGTEMPAWNKVLTDQEIANLAEYVFKTFIRPGAEPEPASHDHHDHGAPAPAPAQHDHGSPAAAPAPAQHDHAPPSVPAPAQHDHGSPAAAPAPAPAHHDHAPPPAAAPAPAHHDHAPPPAAAPAPAPHDHGSPAVAPAPEHHDHAPPAAPAREQ